jgi:hypothetical protein
MAAAAGNEKAGAGNEKAGNSIYAPCDTSLPCNDRIRKC